MSQNERPIFVVGAPRSGTTLLRYMLCGHPRLYIPPESNFIPRFFGRRPHALLSAAQVEQVMSGLLTYKMFFKDWQGERPRPAVAAQRLAGSSPAAFLDALYGDYARQYGAARWGDKSPIYTAYVDLLGELFPQAQFVHIIRDGRDVALSMLKAYHTPRFFYVDMCFAAHTWRWRVHKAVAAGARLGAGRYCEVRYEALVADPESTLRGLCNFLGEEYTPQMTQPQAVASRLYYSKGIHAATRRPPGTQSAGRWRTEMRPADLRLFQSIAGDQLAELGYELAGAGRMTPGEAARYLLLQSKYALIEGGRRGLQGLGIFHPTGLLSRRLRPYPPTTRS